MRIEELVLNFRAAGYRIKKAGNYYFHHRWIKGLRLPLGTSFPYEQCLQVDDQLINALKWKFLVSPILIKGSRTDLYEFTVTTSNYDLDQFDGKTRNRIRKSLKSCEFKRPTLNDLLNEGLAINRQTCERQSRNDRELINEKKWKKLISMFYNSPGLTILGAYYDGKMIAYLTGAEINGKFTLFHAFIDRNYPSSIAPMRGLIYVLINNLVTENGKVTVSYGMHKLSHETSLTMFKRSMLFRRIRATRGFVIHPFLLVMVKMAIFVIVRWFPYKWLKHPAVGYTIRLYQGYRHIKRAIYQPHKHETPVISPIFKIDFTTR